jgi:hypothetical protein
MLCRAHNREESQGGEALECGSVAISHKTPLVPRATRPTLDSASATGFGYMPRVASVGLESQNCRDENKRTVLAINPGVARVPQLLF